MPKKPTDANKPRGPITAYALFVRTCRNELCRKYPEITVDYNVIAKKCSERWKAMNENEKRRFQETAELQRKRYKEELAVYQQEQLAKQHQQQQQQAQSVPSSILLQTPATQYLVESSSQQQQQQQQQQHTLIVPTPVQHALVTAPKKAAKKRKPKDPLAPKKPLSAYFLFCADERPKVLGLQTGMSVSDVARELGVRWKNTPTELKSKYEQAASEKKHVYQAEMAIYKNQTSSGSSPPETPQTPLTPHDYQSTFTSVPMQQSMQLPYDLYDNPSEFDLITHENDEPL